MANRAPIDPFVREVVSLIRSIRKGSVATYGQIAALAGDPRGTRQVVRVLHACSEKEELPWHRVINSQGRISLRPGRGAEEQRRLLVAEGIPVDRQGRVDLETHQWDSFKKRGRRRTFLGLDVRELRGYRRA